MFLTIVNAFKNGRLDGHLLQGEHILEFHLLHCSNLVVLVLLCQVFHVLKVRASRGQVASFPKPQLFEAGITARASGLPARRSVIQSKAAASQRVCDGSQFCLSTHPGSPSPAQAAHEKR